MYGSNAISTYFPLHDGGTEVTHLIHSVVKFLYDSILRRVHIPPVLTEFREDAFAALVDQDAPGVQQGGRQPDAVQYTYVSASVTVGSQRLPLQSKHLHTVLTAPSLLFYPVAELASLLCTQSLLFFRVA